MTETPTPRNHSGWFVWPVVVTATGAGIAFAALLAAWLLPRGEASVWEWPLRKSAVSPLPWTLPAAIALLLAATLTLDTLRAGKTPSRFACAVLVVCLTLCSGSLMLSMMVDDTDFPYRASAAILGDMSMGYYLQATRVSNVRGYIRSVESRSELGQVPQRVATHPPGPVLYYLAAARWLGKRPELLARLDLALQRWSGDKNLEAMVLLGRRVATFGPDRRDVALSFWPGLVLTFTAPFIVPFMYGLGAVALNRRFGLVAAVLACAIPSLMCFAPSVDGPNALIAGAVILAWVWALRAGSWVPAALCGAIWMLGLFWGFGLVALAAVLVVLGVVWWRDQGERARPAEAIIGLAFGLAITQLAWVLLCDYDPVVSTLRALDVQRQVMLLNNRPYGLSMLWNLYDFVLFAGPTLVVMAVAGTFLGIANRERPHVLAGIGLSIAVTLVALVLTGRTRGEVGRIWGFLMPPLVIPAAAPILLLRGWGLIAAGLLTLAGQLCLVIAINSFLGVVAP